jgi:DMSO/TMAO reductase YedYZ molybdopterin-dependent catalytic subunit
MPRRVTNLLLLTLTLALAGSGLVAWILPEGQAGFWYDLHRAAGIGLLVALLPKAPIVRGSLARRLGRPQLRRSTAPGLLTMLAVLGALGLGVAWSVGLLDLESFGGYSPLNVHVQLGLLLVPLVVWHLSRRWERDPPLTSLVRRRVVLGLAGLAGAALVGWRLADATAARVLPEGVRRSSGSRHVGSFTGNGYPETIWLVDRVPSLDADAWRLEVSLRGRMLATLGLVDLAMLPTRTHDAVLDCTGGWWSEQRWSGWRVEDVLALAGVRGEDGRAVQGVAEVVSAAGHRLTFPLAELQGMLLATHVGGEPLTAGHGAPVRLVAPGRRGFQWIKWVTRIDVV